jgi:hypothetical protein
VGYGFQPTSRPGSRWKGSTKEVVTLRFLGTGSLTAVLRAHAAWGMADRLYPRASLGGFLAEAMRTLPIIALWGSSTAQLNCRRRVFLARVGVGGVKSGVRHGRQFDS